MGFVEKRFGDRQAVRIPEGVRATPWDAIQFPEQKTKKLSAIQKARRLQRAALNHCCDYFVGAREKICIILTGAHSIRAEKEWLEYYRGLYDTTKPSKGAFLVLFKRNGVPALINPYPSMHRMHYEFGEGALVNADLQALESDDSEVSGYAASALTVMLAGNNSPSLKQVEDEMALSLCDTMKKIGVAPLRA